MKSNNIYVWVVCALLIGGLVGSFAFPTTNEVIVNKEVIKEVPVEVVKEVVKEVPVESESPLDKALAEFLVAVEDEEDEAGNDVDALDCDGDSYDFDEVSVSKVSDEWSVTYDGDKETVNFEVKLKYKESDSRSCRETYNVEVAYEQDEDTEVTIL